MSKRPSITAKLTAFSDDELLEEILRRKNKSEHEDPERQWCDDCHNFRHYGFIEAMPDNYNPCSKGHKMSFHCPDSPSDEFGYYRRVCLDREDATPTEGRADG